jgi:hypothetical protein
MADYAALREAEALVALADEIAARIAAELRAMEQACQLAREGLARVATTAAKSVEHLRFLGGEERQGRQLQKETVAELAGGDRLRSRLAAEGLAAAFLVPPALAAVAQLPAQPVLPSHAPLPCFAAPRREELEREPLPVAPRQAGWDLLAAEVRTFEDRYEEAMARLDAAEEEIRKERKRRPARKPRREAARKAEEKP